MHPQDAIRTAKQKVASIERRIRQPYDHLKRPGNDMKMRQDFLTLPELVPIK